MFSFLVLFALAALLWSPLSVQAAGFADQVPTIFKGIFGSNPTATEKAYWVKRATTDKKTSDALKGAMLYQKARGTRMPTVTPAKAATAAKPAGKATAADKQKMIVETLPLFIKIYGNNPSNAEKAWWRKRIACDEIKSMKDLENSMRFHKTKNVRKGKDTICGQSGATATPSQSGVTARRVAGVSDHPMGNIVRIGIFKTDGSPITLAVNGEFQVREGADKILGTAGKDDEVSVSWSGGKYHVRGAAGEFDVPNKVRIVPLNGAIVQIKSYSDPSKTIPGKNYNRFRGIMEIRKCEGCGELWAINELHTEHYLRGLAETSGDGPAEYIKALGIAARTYVLYHRVVTGGRNIAKDYDITNTADDQLYRGYEYETLTPRMSSIFNQVKGVIVTNSEGDVPVSTVYFSDSDGRTRSAKEAWGTERFAHLQQSVDDPHHASSSCRGHCVGMSAQGAYGFANKDGWSWQKILSYYYRGVKFVRAY